jgi:hypothetical protein
MGLNIFLAEWIMGTKLSTTLIVMAMDHYIASQHLGSMF